jgi:NADH-quinone oxidoreductase subunit J
MPLQVFCFYAFAIVTVASAFMVIAARNPVHSVLFLILAFFSSAGLFVLIGAEFIAMILVIVYVGAVAVLFLFVVMMLDINFVQLRQGFLQYAPVGGIVGLILLVELIMIALSWIAGPSITASIAAPTPDASLTTNTDALGQLFYTTYVYLFQGAGMILLVAMIGAIVLTHRTRPGVRKQRIADQVHRDRRESIEVRSVEPGQGI